MKHLLLIFTLVGCSTTRDYVQMSEQVAEYGIQKIKDPKENVACYVYRDKDSSSLSCLRLKKGTK